VWWPSDRVYGNDFILQPLLIARMQDERFFLAMRLSRHDFVAAMITRLKLNKHCLKILS